jgi:hypothetical protein
VFGLVRKEVGARRESKFWHTQMFSRPRSSSSSVLAAFGLALKLRCEHQVDVALSFHPRPCKLYSASVVLYVQCESSRRRN